MIVCLIMVAIQAESSLTSSLLQVQSSECLPKKGVEVAVLRLRVEAEAGYFVQG